MGNSFRYFMSSGPSQHQPHHGQSDWHLAKHDQSKLGMSSSSSPTPPPPPPLYHHHPHLLSSPSRFSFRRSQKSRWINSCQYSLLQLIAHRDWQQVLIRATLRPTEISQWHVWRWNHESFDVLPLHLACALQPPPQVIAMLLRFHSDTARTWMCTATTTAQNNNSTTNGRTSSPSRLRRRLWISRRRRMSDADGTDYSILSASSHRVNSTTASPNEDDDDDCFSIENSIGDLEDENNKNGCSSMPMIDPIQEEDEEDDDDDDDDESEESSNKERLLNNDENSDEEDEFHDAASKASQDLLAASIHSHSSSLGSQIVLQLTTSGGLESLTLKQSKSTEETSSTTEGGTTTNDPSSHNLPAGPRPPAEKLQLLPLHVACLYQASPQVLRMLLDAFPEGVRTPSLGGMLPIHLLCSAGGTSPALGDDTQLRDLLMDQANPIEDADIPHALAVLVQAYPDSRSMPCRRHGLTPQEYAKQHGWWQPDVWQWLLNPDNDDVEDFRHHQQRLQQLSSKTPSIDRDFFDFLETSSYDSPFADDSSGTASSAGIPFDIQYNRSTERRTLEHDFDTSIGSAEQQPDHNQASTRESRRNVSLFAMLLSQDWEDALALIEEDPIQATEWHYGIDEHNVPWKRLPLHLVCAWDAPMGLVQVLLNAFPEGAASLDPYDGALPMHVACQTMEPDLDVVRLLLESHSAATKATDVKGRCPLHYAAVNAARHGSDSTDPYAVLQALVQEDPESVFCRDCLGKTPSEWVVSMVDPSPESTTVVKFLEAIQKGVMESSDDDVVCFQASVEYEPGSHREV